MKTRLKLTGKKVSFAKTRWRKKKRRQRRRVLFFCLLGLPLILLVIALVAIYLWLRPLLANLPSPDDVVTSNERFSVVSQIFDAFNAVVQKMAYTQAVAESGYVVPQSAVNREMLPETTDRKSVV